jgi:hypothetical protein
MLRLFISFAFASCSRRAVRGAPLPINHSKAKLLKLSASLCEKYFFSEPNSDFLRRKNKTYYEFFLAYGGY